MVSVYLPSDALLQHLPSYLGFSYLGRGAWEIDGETVEIVSDFIFGGSKSLQMVISAMKLKDAYSLEGKL